MGFGAAISHVLSNYVGFQGRARRSEYWWWVLFTIILGIVAGVVDMVVDPSTPTNIHAGYVGLLLDLALLLPSLAVAIRRLHDTDRSGWWILLAFIPIIGWIILIYWYCVKGTDGDNQFGPDPTKA